MSAPGPRDDQRAADCLRSAAFEAWTALSDAVFLSGVRKSLLSDEVNEQFMIAATPLTKLLGLLDDGAER